MTNNRHTITVTQISKTKIQARICINQEYRRIYDVAKRFNAHIPTRKGFGYLEPKGMPQRTGVWCIQTNNNKTGWENVVLNNGDIIKERKTVKETPLAFQERINKSGHYDVGVQRLCFAKINGMYRFLGVYVVSMYDFDNQTVVFRRVRRDLIEVKKTRTIRNTIVIETKETIEETHLI